MAEQDKASNRGPKYQAATYPLKMPKTALLSGVAKQELFSPSECRQYIELLREFQVDRMSAVDRSLVLTAILQLVKCVRYEKEIYAEDSSGTKVDEKVHRKLEKAYATYLSCLKLSGRAGEQQQEASGKASAMQTISEILGGKKDKPVAN